MERIINCKKNKKIKVKQMKNQKLNNFMQSDRL